MKRILLTIIFVLCASVVFGETYILYDTDTKEIISISPEDDAVLQEGQTKIVIKDNFYDIVLTAQPTDYKYKNNKFIKNIEKISEKAIKKQKDDDRFAELLIIHNKAKEMACLQLETDGVVFKEIDCDNDFK